MYKIGSGIETHTTQFQIQCRVTKIFQVQSTQSHVNRIAIEMLAEIRDTFAFLPQHPVGRG